MAGRTHNSNPPPGGGWVDASDAVHAAAAAAAAEGGACGCGGGPPRQAAPDGGYGWVIVAANALLQMVLISTVAGFGLVLVESLSRGSSNAQVACMLALLVALANCLAPVSTGLGCYYSGRTLTLFGVILVAVGLLLCSLASSVVWQCLCYGVVGGIGLSLALPHGFMIGQRYFSGRRVQANALSMIGGSLGFMVMPPLLGYLLEEFTPRGGFIIWAGVVLHGALGAVLLHPVEWHLKSAKKEEQDEGGAQRNGAASQVRSDVSGSKRASKRDEMSEYDGFEDNKQLTPEDDDSEESDEEEPSTLPGLRMYQDRLPYVCAGRGMGLASDRPWKNPLTDTLQTNEYLERPRTVSIERSMEILPQIPEEAEEDDLFESFDQETGNERIEFLNRENDHRHRPVSFVSTKSADSFASVPTCETMFRSSDIFNQFGSALSAKTEKLKDRAQEEASKTLCQAIANPYKSRKQPLKPRVCCGMRLPRCREVVPFHILRHPLFVVAALSNVINRIAWIIYIAFLPALAVSHELVTEAPFLLSIFAASELLAKLLMAGVGDRGWMERRYYHILANFNGALAAIAVTLAWDFRSISLCVGWFGFSMGIIIALAQVLLAENLSSSHLSQTHGIMLFLTGISGLVIIPFAGWMSDIVGSYMIIYYVICGLSFVPCLLWGLVPCIAHHQGQDLKTPTDLV